MGFTILVLPLLSFGVASSGSRFFLVDFVIGYGFLAVGVTGFLFLFFFFFMIY